MRGNPQWAHLPEEIVNKILEFACTGIVDEITDISHGYEDVDFGQGLREFSQLSRVSHQFHRLLSSPVRVDSLPVRKYLISLQAFAFSSLLNYLKDKDVEYPPLENPWRPGDEDDWAIPDIDDIKKRCGPVWNNLSFPKLFTRVLEHEEWISPQLLFWCIFLAPLKVSTVVNESTGDNIKRLPYDNLFVGKKGTGSDISFTVGRNGFRQPFRGYDSVWNGTSVSRVSVPGRFEVELTEQEEGKCWLWFERRKANMKQWLRYLVIDYRDRTVFCSKHQDEEWWETMQMKLPRR